MGNIGPLQIETVRGTPVRVHGRTLTPVVRVLSVLGHQGTVRERSVEGSGWGVALVKPLQVIEQRDGKETVHPIPDATAAALRQMALVSLLVSVVSLVLIAVNRAVRDG